MSDADSFSDREMQLSPRESDPEYLWDAIEILKQKKDQYLIKWSGLDPKTGKPWPDSWTNKSDCTYDLIQTWEEKRAQKKKEEMLQRKAKKNAKTRNSTISEGSKASTSRRVVSAATSTRSLRSRTAVPDDRSNDTEQEYESISRTPGNRKKRRLSKAPVLVPDSDYSPPVPESRPAKKRRIFSDTHQKSTSSDNARRPKEKKVEGDASPRASSRKHTEALSDDDDMGPIMGTNGKGKSVDRSPPLPGGPHFKKSSFLQRHLEKFLDQDTDHLGHKTPLTRSPNPTPGRTPSGLFSLNRTNSLSRAENSSVLSPRAQARLDRFDHELAAPTQEYAEKTPLFLPASSEERDSMPPRSRSRSRSASHPRSHHFESPSRSHPPAQRVPSPVVSDYARTPTPPPRSRYTYGRRAPADSFRVGDVPETQSTPESPSPLPSPVVIPSPRKTVKSQMKPRSTTSLSFLPRDNGFSATATKQLVPIPPITAAQFAAQVRGTDGLDPGEDADAEEVDELVSSIEQFSSPEKGKGAGKKARRRVLDPKGKGRQRAAEEAGEEEEDVHERVVARGVELAEAARAERRAKMAEYDDARKAKRTTLSQILEPKQRASEGVGVSMSTEEDITMPSGENGFRHSRCDIKELRQEEEENTQDVMAFYQSGDDQDAGSRAGGDSNPGQMANGHHSEDEDSAGGVGHRSEEEDLAGGAGNRSEGEDSAGGAGERSEADDSAIGARYRSEDRETDADGHYDLDVPERAAWNEEHASQQRLEDLGNFSQDPMQDDSIDGNLMYPPSEAQESPENKDDQERLQEDEDNHSQDGMQSIEAQAHPFHEEPDPAVPMSDVPPVTNGRLSKSRSTSARSRSKKPTDDAVLELPPTASTRHNTPETQSDPVETVADPRHLDAARSLLNVKSNENIRLEGELADERAMLLAERAKNVVLQERVKTLESQSSASTGDTDLANRLKVVEELLAAERASRAAALQSIEAERDSARRELAGAEQQRDLFQEYYLKASQFAEEKGSENRELEKRVKIAEEQTKEGITTIKATFDLREATLKSETRDWRNQANFLREQAIRTNDDDLRRRAAEHPELVAKYSQLVLENESLADKVEFFEEDLLVKQEDILRLQQQLNEANEELGGLKAERFIAGDTRVFRCGWRAENNFPCPAFCMTQEDLDLHASMHINSAVMEPSLFSSQ